MELNEIARKYIGSLKYTRESIGREVELKPSSDIRTRIGPRRAEKTFLMLTKELLA